MTGVAKELSDSVRPRGPGAMEVTWPGVTWPGDDTEAGAYIFM